MRDLSSVFQKVATAVLGLAFLVCTVLQFRLSLRAPLSTDEGYNLEVVDNLARGKGYASYGTHRLDAWWSVQSLPLSALDPQKGLPDWPFDPRVTTGPAVLLPLALVWSIFPHNIVAVRTTMWFFFLFAVLAIFRLARYLNASPSAALVASTFFCTLFFNFHPCAVLGELPGTTFFLWGIASFFHGHIFLAGSMLALAVGAKVVFLFPSLFVLFCFFLSRYLKRRSAPFALIWGFLLPLLLFELYKLFSVKAVSAWLETWWQFRAFSDDQTGLSNLALIPRKIKSIATIGPGLWVFVAFGAATVSGALASYRAKLRDIRFEAISRWVVPLSGVALVVIWFFLSAQTSYRQAMPGFFLAYVGATLALPWWKELSPPSMRDPTQTVASVAAFGVLLATFLTAAQWTRTYATFRGWDDGIEAQRAAAQALRASGASAISHLVRWVEPFPLLSGLRVAPCPAPNQALVVTLWAQAMAGKPREHFSAMCQSPIAENRDVLICFPRAEFLTAPAVPIRVTNWGPRETKVGEVPNRQPSGHGAFWFKVETPVTHKPNLLLVADGRVVSPVTWSADATWFSSLLPRWWVEQPGSISLQLWDFCDNQAVEVGDFVIYPRP